MAPAAAGETAAPLVIVGGTVIHGTGRPPLPDGVVVIRNGKFVSVTSAETGSLPADARRIDADGKWIIPGLIDMHCALSRVDGRAAPPSRRDDGP